MSRWVWSALAIAALLVGVWQATFWIARELIEGPREELVLEVRDVPARGDVFVL